MDTPKRAIEVVIRAGGDTREDVRWLLRSILQHIDSGSPWGVHGGVHSGGDYRVIHRPEQTHERFMEELDAWIASRGDS